MSKPFSQACENNKAVILPTISQYFHDAITVLELGSYTAQHIQYFAEKLPQIRWQPSDTSDNLAFLTAGLKDVALVNILPPLVLDVSQQSWPMNQAGGIFSANTLHIMPQTHVKDFFDGAGKTLEAGGYLCVYGPFKYDGEFTSDSNARFELWLKERDPLSGVRDFEEVNALAQQAGMTLVADHTMPANNQLLVWQKEP
jgi:hypothetical protein